MAQLVFYVDVPDLYEDEIVEYAARQHGYTSSFSTNLQSVITQFITDSWSAYKMSSGLSTERSTIQTEIDGVSISNGVAP